MTTSRLAIVIDPTGAETGGRVVKGQLDGIKQSAGEAETSVKRFGPAANQNFRQAAAGAQVATTAFNTMRVAIAGIVGMVTALAAVPYLRITDQSKQLNAQLLLVAGSSEKAAIASAKLRDVAEQTRSRFAPTVELYTKIVRATDQLGISQDRLMNVTKAISQSYRISGASAEESANSMRQLAQGLAAGALRGDEFISVMENAPRLARAIADGMGVTVGQLRKLAADGKLTAETIVKALEGQAEALQREFGKIPQTSSEAFGRVADSLSFLIAKFDAATGISDAIIAGINKIGDAIDFLTDNMDTAAKVVKILGAAMLVAFGPAALAAIASLTRAIAIGLVGAVNALTLAIARNPLGFLAVAITVIITSVWQFRDAIGKVFGVDLGAIVKDSANFIVGTLVGAFNAVMIIWDALPDHMDDIGRMMAHNLGVWVRSMLRDMLIEVNKAVAAISSALGFEAAPEIEQNKVFPEYKKEGGKIVPLYPRPEIATGAQDAIDNAAKAFRDARARDWVGQFGEAKDAADSAADSFESVGKAAAASADDVDKLAKAAQKVAQSALDDANSTALKAIEDTRNTYKDAFKGFFSDLRSGLEEGKGLWRSFADAAINALDKIASKLMDRALDTLFNGLFGPSPSSFRESGGGLLGMILGGTAGAANDNSPVGAAAQSILLGAGGRPNAPVGNLAAYREAIASIESAGSGGYSAIGPTSPTLGRALGKYQVMEANIGPWSKQALGRSIGADEFLQNPGLQDSIFDNKFGGYVNKYGERGAAQAWFGGEGSVGKLGRTDVLGTSVGGYGDKFMKALDKTSGSLDTLATKSIDASSGITDIAKSLTGGTNGGGGLFGLGLSNTGSGFMDGRGGGLMGMLGGLGGGVAPAAGGGGILQWLMGLFGLGGFASGGYTGPGGVNELRGAVHAGEVVFSQNDIRRNGGVGAVEAMRTGYGGRDGRAAANVNFTSTVINNAGVKVEKTEEEDADGGRHIVYTISDQVTAAMNKPGTSLNKEMRNRGAAPARKRRS